MSEERKLVLSVTLADCDVTTFRCGGNGGQKVDKTSSGVRIIHRESGARGESRESRSQLQNKRAAFERMAASARFQTWLKMKLGAMDVDRAEVERKARNKVERDLREENLKWEYFDG